MTETKKEVGKMIGGPLEGSRPEQSMITLQCRYNQIALNTNSRMPATIYERIRNSNDFQWVATFQDEEELRLWSEAHPNEWSYH